MKKFLLLSVVAAGLLFVGCGEKPKEEKKEVTQTKEVTAPKAEEKIEEVKKEEPKPEAKEEPKQENKEEVKKEAEKKVEEAKGAIDAAKLYAKCAGCHGAKGEKKALGKSAPIGGMDKAKLTEDIKGYKAGTLNRYGMGALMKGQVGSLNDEEIDALAEYISKLK